MASSSRTTYVVTGGWQTGREATYVAFSRSREATHVYTDYSSLDLGVHDRKAALRELAERPSESQAKVSAIGRIDEARVAIRTEAQHDQKVAHQLQSLRQPAERYQEEAAEPAAYEKGRRRQREQDAYEETGRQRDGSTLDCGLYRMAGGRSRSSQPGTGVASCGAVAQGQAVQKACEALGLVPAQIDW
jgi:hypothetical protein